MRKKDIIKNIQKLDADSAAGYLRFTPEEDECLRQKIADRLPQEASRPHRLTVTRTPRLARLHHVTVAAASVLLCIGMTGGIVWFGTHAPTVPQDHMQSSVPDGSTSLAHAVGDRYAAENLTASGTLWITVSSISREDGLCRIDLLLENEQASSLSDNAPYRFYADNVQILTEDGTRLPPCQMQTDAAGELPYTIELHPGKSCEVSLWYTLDASARSWRIVTGTSADTPYTIIQSEEQP